MKKSIKIILLVVLGIILIWFLIYLVDLNRFKKNQKPLIVFKTNNYIYSDGTATEYISFGYKMIVYNRKSITEKSFKLVNNKLVNSTESFYILDKNSKECKDEKTIFHEDDQFKYYFDCKREYEVNYYNKKYTLDQAIKNNIFTIDELESLLKFNKENK